VFKNVSSQKVALFAFDATTGLPKTGDGANITPYVSKDYGTVTALGTATATEMDSTNAKGWYSFVLTQAETNGDMLLFTAKSSTANISVVGLLIATQPANWTTLSVDGSGRVDVAKIGGTSQTARDIGASVLLSSGTGTGQVSLSSGLVDITQTAADKAWSTTSRLLTAGTNIQLPSNGLANVTAWTVNITGSLSGAVGSVTGNVGGNVVGSVASVSGAVGSVTGSVGGNVVGSVGSVTGLTASNLDATISSRLASASYTAPPTAAQNATAVLTTQMTESYATLHSAPTLAQGIFEVRSLLAEKSVATTTLTTKKIDGSTTAGTYTLNDSVSPTSITKAS